MLDVTIITACLNSDQTIAKTLDSARQQSMPAREHIFIDGGSSDNTLTTIAKYADEMPNTVVKIANNVGGGVYNALNHGIKLATSPYILILHSDDYFCSAASLEMIHKNLTNNPHYDVFFYSVKIIARFNKSYFSISRNYPVQMFNIKRLCFGIMPPHTGMVISKKLMDQYGEYPTEIKIGADFDLIAWIFLSNHRPRIHVWYDDNVLIHMTSGGLSNRGLTSSIAISKDINKVLASWGLKYTWKEKLIGFLIKIKYGYFK